MDAAGHQHGATETRGRTVPSTGTARRSARCARWIMGIKGPRCRSWQTPRYRLAQDHRPAARNRAADVASRSAGAEMIRAVSVGMSAVRCVFSPTGTPCSRFNRLPADCCSSCRACFRAIRVQSPDLTASSRSSGDQSTVR